jgi:hypothetical protein
MTDVNNTNETLNTDKVSLNTAEEATTNATQSTGAKRVCNDWSQCKPWQGKSRKKVILAAVLIALFGFMLGKATSHHHNWHQGSYQQQMYEGNARMPLSMILDGIEATPAQRAKAVELVR